MKERILSGMRPTGRLHLGNYLGALATWVKLQDIYECFFMVADWHALTDRSDTSHITSNTKEVLLDWLASGLDPDKATLFVQSQVPEHAELHLLLSMITPTPWLERCPTYKDKLSEGAETTYGLLGYPVLQAADILMYRAQRVPVGEDQLAHLEICREIARRFNSTHGRVFPEPQPLMSPTTRIMGTDGAKKMSKSADNFIALADPPDTIRAKVKQMFTDATKVYKGDPGHPDTCNVFTYHTTFGQPLGEDTDIIAETCVAGTRMCSQCKKELAEILVQTLTPFQKRRSELEQNQAQLEQILRCGAEHARTAAADTMQAVRETMHLAYPD